MTLRLYFLCALFTISHFAQAQSEEHIDQILIYEALASEDLQQINRAVKEIKDHSSVKAQAYKGVLLMKKAGLVNGPGKKLAIFKEGKDLLENSIHADQENVEYRFLRLMIQENAPAILGYKDNLEEDVSLVANFYHNFNSTIQNAIKGYSKKSTLIVVKDN
ncbi:MAG: hypothetical protein ACNS60_00935 [Candidatus Cyclobacteriaceae bacterium M2_1C_046]